MPGLQQSLPGAFMINGPTSSGKVSGSNSGGSGLNGSNSKVYLKGRETSEEALTKIYLDNSQNPTASGQKKVPKAYL